MAKHVYRIVGYKDEEIINFSTECELEVIAVYWNYYWWLQSRDMGD